MILLSTQNTRSLYFLVFQFLIANLTACGLQSSRLTALESDSHFKIKIGAQDGPADRHKFFLSAPTGHTDLALCQIDPAGNCLPDATYSVSKVATSSTRDIYQASQNQNFLDSVRLFRTYSVRTKSLASKRQII